MDFLKHTHGAPAGYRVPSRFDVLGVLGSGSVGTVFHVLDKRLDDQELALKIPHAHLAFDSTAVARVRREIVICRQLAHPGIVRILHSDELPDGTPYFTMEYVQGCNLGSFIEQHSGRRVPADETRYLLRQILEALSFAHEKGVLHRDLKPENILLGANGAVKLADFGIAESFADGLDFTRTGECVGSPAYMAPEQFRRETAGPETDLYSLGIVAFRMLVGRLPYTDHSFVGLAKAHLQNAFPLHLLDGHAVPEDLRTFIEGCVATAPEQRFESAGAAVAVLQDSGAGQPSELRTRVCAVVRAKSGVLGQSSLVNALLFLALLISPILGVVLMSDEHRPTLRIQNDLMEIRFRLGVDLSLVEYALGFGVPDSLDERALLKSVRDGDLATFTCLLRLGADAGTLVPGDPQRNTIAHAAIEADIGYLTPLLYRGFEFSQRSIDEQILSLRNGDGDSLLFAAVKRRDMTAIEALAYLPVPALHSPDKSGDTPLLFALRNDDREVASMLLRSGRVRDIFRLDPDGLAAAHRAAVNGDAVSLQAVLRMSNPVALRDSQGRTPLMAFLATPPKESQLPILRMLRRVRGESLPNRDNAGRPLEWYVANTSAEMRDLYTELTMNTGAAHD